MQQIIQNDIYKSRYGTPLGNHWRGRSVPGIPTPVFLLPKQINYVIITNNQHRGPHAQVKDPRLFHRGFPGIKDNQGGEVPQGLQGAPALPHRWPQRLGVQLHPQRQPAVMPENMDDLR